LARYPWDEVFLAKSVDEQVEIFHKFLRNSLDKYFPEKVTKMSVLDKKWMNPHSKQIHRAMKREFFKNRKSQKYKQLKSKFKKMKRQNLKSVYKNFVSNLKVTDPGKWYAMAKQIGAVTSNNGGDIQVESLSHLTNGESAQRIAEHFASV
jgi:hypothetical protein